MLTISLNWKFEKLFENQAWYSVFLQQNGAFVKSQRGKDLLYFEGYKHRICRVETGGRSSWWRCTKKTCRGRVRLTVEGITLVEQHNHSPLTSVDSYSSMLLWSVWEPPLCGDYPLLWSTALLILLHTSGHVLSVEIIWNLLYYYSSWCFKVNELMSDKLVILYWKLILAIR